MMWQTFGHAGQVGRYVRVLLADEGFLADPPSFLWPAQTTALPAFLPAEGLC